MSNERGQALGQIVRGSLSQGLVMRLSPRSPIESIRSGNFVVVERDYTDSENRLRRLYFFAMITDVTLSATDSRLHADPPGDITDLDRLLQNVLPGTSAYADVELRPMLMAESQPGNLEITQDDLRPVKTIPAHFCAVHEASDTDVANVFGKDEGAEGKHFFIGTPLDMEMTPVCIDLDRLVERSSGIFGKSGTGKTFLTRLCLCGILRAKKAVNLIFDMHSEYGWTGNADGQKTVRGLKEYFPGQVAIFTLDPESAIRRRVRTDFDVKIPYSQIEPDDILLLQNELNLTPTAAEVSYTLQRRLGKDWIGKFLKMDGEGISDFAEETNGNTASLAALQRRLNYLVDVCGSFLVPELPGKGDDAVDAILRRIEQETSVVLEFGRNNKTLSYMLVANILTRRIHSIYTRRTEEAMGDAGKKPIPLVITIEEAHKFLSPQLASQTIFGTIARELRKYNVTLLVVDQRPSGIDDEVLSQIGTRITCLLNDEKDINAVLTGVAGAKQLAGVLASLDSKQQALVFGHAVPMPVVIKTRTYDTEEFFRAMTNRSGSVNTIATDLEAFRKAAEDDFAP